MATQGLLKNNTTGEIIYPVTLPDCVINSVIVVDQDSIEVEIGKYYRFDEVMNNITIILPLMDDTTRVKSLTVFFTTGDSPKLNLSIPDTSPMKYQEGFSIEPNTTYELNIMWNGKNWIVAYGIIG